MKKRFTEEQIIRILQEGEQAENTRVVCRWHNVTEQTYYRWRNKYGGMDVSEVIKGSSDACPQSRATGTHRSLLGRRQISL